MTQRRPTEKPARRTAFLRPVRVTPDELEAVQQKADAAGLTLSEYQRQACLGGRIVVRDEPVNVEAVRQLLAIGRNLNQITKSGHIHKSVDEAALRSALAKINEAVEGLL